jgi:hypothetical protein
MGIMKGETLLKQIVTIEALINLMKSLDLL